MTKNTWPDGTPRSQGNAFTAYLVKSEPKPLTTEEKNRIQTRERYRRKVRLAAALVKATRVNRTISIDPNPQASADKQFKIKGKL